MLVGCIAKKLGIHPEVKILLSNSKPSSSDGDDNNGSNDNNGINDDDDDDIISYDIEEDANAFTNEESSLLSYDSKSIMLVAPSKAD